MTKIKNKQNGKIKKTKKVEQLPTSTILIDKLIFSCVSVVEDNFDYMVIHDPEYWHTDFKFGQTKLVRTQDPSNRYRHSYKVYYGKYLMGILDFALYNSGIYTNMLRFTVYNEVFYRYRLKYISIVLDDLNLKINNFKQIDIAVDSYKFNSEKVVRNNLKDKGNTVKLIGDIVYDRNKTLNVLYYYNKGSLNNPYKIRTILIKKKKKNTSEIMFYDKTEEINEVSKKYYILEFHQEQNPKCKKIYRSEIRFGSEELRRYIKKIKRTITFEDLLDPQFLNDMFFEYLDGIITISKGTGRKKTQIQLVEKPVILQPQGILQPTLSVYNSTPSIHKNEYFNMDKFINEYSNKIYNNQLFINSIRNNMNNYINNNKSKYIRV
ncbi:MAG: hypothetical protein ACK5KN_01485 [Dysgonomonas sp.]|uniref:hypothetical protein n=1 Tax=Dysgonomonas sp. TaxID=1891233 RepID=UPI003A840791